MSKPLIRMVGKKAQASMLAVYKDDGSVIQHNKATDTFIEVFSEAVKNVGPEKVCE